MTEILVQVVDRTSGEEDIGTYRALVAPRIGELLAISARVYDDTGTRITRDQRVIRIEEVYWMAHPANDDNAISHGTFKARPVDRATVFGRAAEGPWEP